MPAALTKGLGFDDLPAPLKEKALDMLLADQATRKVSAMLADYGYKLSHNAIARYKRTRILPAIQTGAKFAQIQDDAGGTDLQRSKTSKLTKEIIAAKPILEKLGWIWSEVKDGVDETKSRWLEDEGSAVCTGRSFGSRQNAQCGQERGGNRRESATIARLCATTTRPQPDPCSSGDRRE